jgi:zinc protease
MFSDSLSPLTSPFVSASTADSFCAADSVSAVPSLHALAQDAIARADLSRLKIAQALDLPQCVTLSNGMTLYLRQRKDINAQQPFACLRLAVRAGSMSEDSALAEQQMAHFVEHGLFQGTESFSVEEIKKLMEEIKCPFGADGNAHTDIHETVYKFNNIPLAEGEYFNKCLHLLFEFACKATFPPETMLKERIVIESEHLARIGPDWREIQFIYSQLRKGSGEAEHLADALDPQVQTCGGEELHQHLMSFYKKWYQPHNMALIVVGDFRDNVAEIFQSIEELFNKIPTAEAQGIEEHRLKKAYPIPPKDKILYTCFTHSQLSQSSVEIRTQIPNEQRPSLTPQEIERLLFQELIHSLCLKIFEKRLTPLTAFPDNSFTAFGFSPFPNILAKFTNFTIWSVTANKGRLAEAFKSFASHIFTFYKKGVRESELIAVKKQMDSDSQYQIAGYPNLKNQDLITEYVKAFSHESPFSSRLINLSNTLYYLKKISPTEVEKVIKNKWNLFTPEVQKNNYIFASHPENVQPSSLMADVKENFEKILVEEPIQETILLRDDLDWLPKRPEACAPLTIHYNKQLKYNELHFKNGIRVFLKPIDEEQPAIFLKMIIPHGFKNTQSQEDFLALHIGFYALRYVGLADRTKLDITESLRGQPLLNGEILVEATVDHCEFQLKCKNRKGLELALQLLHSRLGNLQPIYSDEFKNNCLTIIKNTADHHTSTSNVEDVIFLEEFKKLLFNEHPLFKKIEPHEYNSISVEQCQEALKRCFQSLSKGSLVICGNFEYDDAIPLVNSYVGALPASPIKEPEKRWPSLPLPTESKEINLYKGEVKDCSKTSMNIPIAYASDPKDAYLLQRTVSVLSQYIEDRIRFKEQLIYSITCSLFPDPSPNPDHLCFNFLNITFATHSSTHAKIQERIFELIKETGERPSQNFLECANVVRGEMKKNSQLDNQSLEKWFYNLCKHLEKGLSPTIIAEEGRWESALTGDEIYRTFRERISTASTFLTVNMHPASYENQASITLAKS